MPTRLQLQRCIFCSRVPSFLMCSLSLIMLSARNSDKHKMEIEQPQFKYWAFVLDFHLCVLRLVRCVRCCDYHPWNVRLNVCPGVLLWTMWTMRCQTFSSLNFFCHGAFVVWKPKQRKSRGNLCGRPIPSSGILLWTDSLYLQTSVQRKMQMFQGSLLCTALCVCD